MAYLFLVYGIDLAFVDLEEGRARVMRGILQIFIQLLFVQLVYLAREQLPYGPLPEDE